MVLQLTMMLACEVQVVRLCPVESLYVNDLSPSRMCDCDEVLPGDLSVLSNKTGFPMTNSSKVLNYYSSLKLRKNTQVDLKLVYE